MAGDYSRKTFNREKNYSGVLMQQGRVQLDADWNEQWEIQQEIARVTTRDVIGSSGVPKKGGGFAIGVTAGGNDLTISPGRIYVDGLLFDLHKATGATYFNQPFYPAPDGSFFNLGESPPESPASPPFAGLKDGDYIAYLDAWQREINFHDDPHIHEVALGEADTTTRMQNVWQVKLLQVTPPTAVNPDCKTSFTEWDKLTAKATGKLNAKTITVPGQNPCQLPPSSGYRRLENQLYRVEVQKGGPLASATFKWSRDNASVETVIQNIDNSIITVADLGKDKELGFALGQWVEIVDDESSLQSSPNPLVNIQLIDPGELQITVNTSVAQYSGKPGLKLRRWDQATSATANGLDMSGGGWIELEDGIQVNFSAGTYNAGDYWLIPARTATGDIEWPPYSSPGASPEPQHPVGTHHHYCRLALIQVQNGTVIINDCRKPFPALTELTASDIQFDDTVCNLSGADNVQEAIDLLCAANEIRDHNKFLHGYGVVCGLKVVCGYNRQFVTVQSGYALDCTGNVIKVNGSVGLPYAVVQNAINANLLDNTGTGDVALSLSLVAGQPVISVEKYVEKTIWEEILEGSLLKDFFDDSIGKVLTFLQTQIGPMDRVVPVPIGQRRLSAVINLLFQFINADTGTFSFLSGVQGTRNQQNCANANNDDMLLWCLFNDLRKLLGSDTFCGEFDGDADFPDYKIDPGLKTIYGGPYNFHGRMQLTPDGKFAYTSSVANNTISKYDLKTEELVKLLIFPGDSHIVLVDIAMSPDGKQLVAVGTLNKDSYFATLDVATDKWSESSPVTNALYGRIAFAPATPDEAKKLGISPGVLYGSVVGTGIFEISGIGTSNFSTKMISVNPLNATGSFAITVSGGWLTFAFTYGNPSTTFDFVAVQLFTYFPTKNSENGPSIPFTGTENSDDIIFYRNTLYITGTGTPAVPNIRVMGSLMTENGGAFTISMFPADPNQDIPQPSNTMRLAGFNDQMLVLYSDNSWMPRVSLDNLNKGGNINFDKASIPVQIFPSVVAVSADNSRGYVLNSIGNTITLIDFEKVYSLSNPPDFTNYPPADIANYKKGMDEAYKQIFTHLLEFLKDAFCDQFLIDCPTCGPDDKVYLGVVHIDSNKVFKICNFRKRKYVKTFRTVGHWLSTVPILPAMKEALTQFCCMTIKNKI